MFPVIELYNMYGPSLLAAALTSATVIWQTNTSSGETNRAIGEFREQTAEAIGALREQTNRIENKMNGIENKMNRIENKMNIVSDNILAVTQEVTNAMRTRDLKGMYALAARMKACLESGGGEC
jgi:hypothetical protein